MKERRLKRRPDWSQCGPLAFRLGSPHSVDLTPSSGANNHASPDHCQEKYIDLFPFDLGLFNLHGMPAWIGTDVHGRTSGIQQSSFQSSKDTDRRRK